MGEFNGIFDGSVAIDQNREARDNALMLQQQQIRANMSMQQQRLRADQQSQQTSLSASTAAGNDDRALKAQGMASETDLAQQRQDLEQQKFDAGESLTSMKESQAKLMLQQAQQEFDDDQTQRAALTQLRQSAFGAGILSAMLNGTAAPATLTKINRAIGVADGDPGSVVGIGGGTDGAWYDVVAKDEQGKIGKTRQQVDPMALLMVAHSVLGKDGTKEWAQMYQSKDRDNTRMNVALEAYKRAMDTADTKTKAASDLQTQKDAAAAARLDTKNQAIAQIAQLKLEVKDARDEYMARKSPFGEDDADALAAKAKWQAVSNKLRGVQQPDDPLVAAIDGGTPTGKATQTQHGAVAAPVAPPSEQALIMSAIKRSGGDVAKGKALYIAEYKKRQDERGAPSAPTSTSPAAADEQTDPGVATGEQVTSAMNFLKGDEAPAPRTAPAARAVTPTPAKAEPAKASAPSTDGPRASEPAKEPDKEPAKFGPKPGDPEYLRDMPKGESTDLTPKEISATRKEILKRLDATEQYDYPKDKKASDRKRIKAELADFNDKYGKVPTSFVDDVLP